MPGFGGEVEGCLSKTCLAAVSLLKQELQGFRACVCKCASSAVHLDILELFPVAARTKTRAGSVPPYGAASRDNSAETG